MVGSTAISNRRKHDDSSVTKDAAKAEPRREVSFSQQAFSVFRSCRPWTVTIALIPQLLCVAILAKKLNVDITDKLLHITVMIIAFICLQTAGNLHNAVTDFETGLDTKENAKDRSLVDAIVQPRTLVAAYIAFSAVTLAFMGCAISEARPEAERWGLAMVGFIGLVSAYSYSGRPFMLKYIAGGDAHIFSCFGILMPLWQSIYISGTAHHTVVLMMLPITVHTVGIVHSNNYRDIEFDKQSGAKTVAGILGAYRARLYYNMLVLFCPHIAVCVLAWYFQCVGLLCAFWVLPLSITLTQMANGTADEVYVLVKRTAKVHSIFGLCMIIGIFTMPSTTISPWGIAMTAFVGLIPFFKGLRGDIEAEKKVW